MTKPCHSGVALCALSLLVAVTGCGLAQPSAERQIERGDDLFSDERYDEAVEAYTKAIKLDPKNAQTYIDRGLTYRQLGKYAEALRDYRQALQIDDTLPFAHEGVAWILATAKDDSIRNGKLAIEHAQRSRAQETDSFFDDTLAAAYAETGQFDEAVRVQQMAVAAAVEEEVDAEELAELQARLKLYQEKQPFRE